MIIELGDKLVEILSNFKNREKVDKEAIRELVKEVSNALTRADVNLKLALQVRKAVETKLINDPKEFNKSTNKQLYIQQVIADELVSILSPGREPSRFVPRGTNIVMFVGMQGAGKTTTIAKFAHFYKRRGYRVAMVCADTFRAGAFDQLKQNANAVGVPFYGSYSQRDPSIIAAEGVSYFKDNGFDMIIIDTSGRHHQDSELFQEMKDIEKVVKPTEIIYVLDGTNGQSIADQAAAFALAVDVGSVIITKLDGNARGGGALTAVAQTNAPIRFIGYGEKFDQFEQFRPRGFVSRMLGMGDIEGLVETFSSMSQANGGVEKQIELGQKILSGGFTLNDFKGQLEQMMNMGSIGKIAEMIPGFSSIMGDLDSDEANHQFKMFLYIFDSCTEAELNSQKLDWDDRRIMRVARGAGVHPDFISEMISQFETIKKAMSMKGSNKKKMMQMAAQNKNNPAAMMQQMLGNMGMDPSILDQMGGTDGINNMMQQMSQQMGGMGGGMPSLAQVQKMMKGLK